MSDVWTWLGLLLLVVPVVLIWVYSLLDLVQRTDQPARRKLGWILLIVLLPVLGPLIYVAVRRSRHGDIGGFGGRSDLSPRARQLLGEPEHQP